MDSVAAAAATAEEQGNNEAGSDKRGKYMIMAEIKSFDQDSEFLEEELEELEKIQDASGGVSSQLFLLTPISLILWSFFPLIAEWCRSSTQCASPGHKQSSESVVE
ncbi:hypothetical protein MLD38_039312 [Melastoma candidum]|uniref:Uncharacterized protein n=1 Tax=Melastoma candidum TaxID=119954 RepID=A0ACB9L2V6_9MYRT|nr:hypothetical protein MLD38_039312 [Melastoma candidum]